MNSEIEERKVNALESIASSLENLVNAQIARENYEWRKNQEHIADIKKQIAYMEEVDRILWQPHG